MTMWVSGREQRNLAVPFECCYIWPLHAVSLPWQHFPRMHLQSVSRYRLKYPSGINLTATASPQPLRLSVCLAVLPPSSSLHLPIILAHCRCHLTSPRDRRPLHPRLRELWDLLSAAKCCGKKQLNGGERKEAAISLAGLSSSFARSGCDQWHRVGIHLGAINAAPAAAHAEDDSQAWHHLFQRWPIRGFAPDPRQPTHYESIELALSSCYCFLF